MKEANGRLLTSGELASLAHVSPDTLRHYERKGLLPAASRSENGYRHYSPDALERVLLIRAALGLGFTVEELGRILRNRDAGEAPCHEVHKLAKIKLRELEHRIAELSELRRQLLKTIRSWEQRLKMTPSHQPARLLESFAATRPRDRGSISPLVSPGLKKRLERREDKRK